VLNDAFAPGWTAAIDGRSAHIYPVNYLARGVWVEPGRHTLVFEYHTPLLRAGWLMFSLEFAAIACWFFMRRVASVRGPAASGAEGDQRKP